MDKSDKPKCGHPKDRGGLCARDAGWGTTHVGEGYCKQHDESTKAQMGKRSLAKVEYDRARLTEMYVGGSSMYDIADELKLSLSTVSREIQAQHRRWREDPALQFDEMMLRTLANLDRLEYEAWDAWERSKQPRKITTTFGAKGQSPKVQIQIIEQTGDKAYLDLIKDCTMQRAKLGGLVNETPDMRAMGMGIVAGMGATLSLLAQMESKQERGQPPPRNPRIVGLPHDD